MKLSISITLSLSAFLGSLSANPIAIASTGAAGHGYDANYTVTSLNDCSLPASAEAQIVSNPNSGWATPISGSSWINPGGNGYENYCANCYYAFSTTFSLAGLNASTASLSGQVLADDHVALYLNNTLVSSWLGTYTQPTSFSIGSQYSSAFRSGTNTLSFVVENDSGPMGLDAKIGGTAEASAIPEPGDLGMVAGAGVLLVGLGGYRRRKSRQAEATAALLRPF